MSEAEWGEEGGGVPEAIAGEECEGASDEVDRQAGVEVQVLVEQLRD